MARLRKSSRVLVTSPGEERTLAERRLALAEGGVFSLEEGRLFARRAPLEIEIGSGKGDFIIERARAMPGRNFLAIELAPVVFRWLELGCVRAGLENLRAIRADARSIVNLLLPAGSVAAFHIYFPDPWPKTRHSKHRLFSPGFVAGLSRTLASDGILYLATDVGWYFARMAALLEQQGFAACGETFSGELQNSFGRKFDQERRAIAKGSFRYAPPAEMTRDGGAAAI